MELQELKDKLSEVIPHTDFKLDERSILELLNYIQNYTANIPFSDTDNHWNNFFFMEGNSPSKLAALFDNQEADGDLLPHQAFLLAFLQLLLTPQELLNTFPARHRDLYYHDLLGLKRYSAKAGKVAISIELNPNVSEFFCQQGLLLDAGRDSEGNALRYQLDAPLLANQGQLSDLYWYRKNEKDIGIRATPLNSFNNTQLPQEGVRLWAETATDEIAATGLLIASALLEMSAGQRQIIVTFDADIDTEGLIAQATGAEGWIDLEIIPHTKNQQKEDDSDKKIVVLKVPLNAKEICAPRKIENLVFDVPLLKLSRNDNIALPAIKRLDVNIIGSNNIFYSSDAGIENIEGASYPFGMQPLLGSGFNLIAPEWYNKKEATLTLLPEWLGLPAENFSTWYKGYSGISGNEVFKVQPYLIDAKGRQPLGSPLELFKDKAAAKNSSLRAEEKSAPPEANSLKITLNMQDYEHVASNDPQDWPARLYFELTGQDFKHQEYWQDPAEKNPPYTPQINNMICSLAAGTEEFDYYYLTPFGYSQQAESIDTQFQLYLGFDQVKPGQTLSLFWKLQSAQPFPVNWYYLNKEGAWHLLDATVKDDTNGFFQDGLWNVQLPYDAANNTQSMPLERYWLRALITSKESYQYEDLPDLKGVLYNAITATDASPQSNKSQKIIANSIVRPLFSIPEIKSIVQPWDSWGEQSAESEEAFFHRAAQRLANRNRALTWGDIDTLLRQQFPIIFKVLKPNPDKLVKIPAPGRQEIVIIPITNFKDNNDPLRPTLNKARRIAMADWLKEHSSHWFNIEIHNPIYVDIEINYHVVFKPGINIDYGYRQLQLMLQQHYMPWGYNEQLSAIPGNRIDYYQLLAYIQQNPLVERVSKLTLKRLSKNLFASDEENQETIIAEDNEVLILVWPATPLAL